MNKGVTVALALAVGLAAGIPLGNRLMPAAPHIREAPPASTQFAAVPDAIGTQDHMGPYEVVEGWPKDISTLAGTRSGRGVQGRASSRRTRTACIWFPEASCRTFPSRR